MNMKTGMILLYASLATVTFQAASASPIFVNLATLFLNGMTLCYWLMRPASPSELGVVK